MRVLFKDYLFVYYIENDRLDYGSISDHSDIDLYSIPHLDDTEVLYHYRSKESGKLNPVYYEHNGNFISKIDNGNYTRFYIYPWYTKDYTLVNLKLLQDENII